MALAKNATPEEIREYKRKRQLAWVGIILSIAIVLVGAVADLKYNAGSIAMIPTGLGLVCLMLIYWWASKEGIMD